MSKLKLAPHPSGLTIAFEDKRHIYYVHDDGSDYGDLNWAKDIKFTSGTAFIGQFFPKFEKQKISARYAKKHCMRQQDVLDDWAERGRIGREDGTAVHDYAEQVVLGLRSKKENAFDLGKVDPSVNQRVHNMQGQAVRALEYLSRDYSFLEPEMIVASLDLGIAGMLDLPAVNKRTGVKVIFDYKTNKEIKTENIWQSGLTPIKHLQDTNFNHYCLQLNLYEYLGRRDGYYDKNEPVDKTLIHITEDDFTLMPCFDMQNNIECMMKVFHV